MDGEPFAKLSDSWKWRQIDLTPRDLGRPFAPPTFPVGDLPFARELVVLALTGERPQVPRLRCRDVLPSGRRVVIGRFRASGLDVANVSDRWSSLTMGLCAPATPLVPRGT